MSEYTKDSTGKPHIAWDEYCLTCGTKIYDCSLYKEEHAQEESP